MGSCRVQSFENQAKKQCCFPDMTFFFFSLGSQWSWCNSRNIEDENTLFLVGAEEGREFRKRRWREDSVFGSKGTVSVLFLWLYWVEFLAGSIALHPSDNSPAWLSIVSTFQWLKMEVAFSNSISTSMRRMSNPQCRAGSQEAERVIHYSYNIEHYSITEMIWLKFHL